MKIKLKITLGIGLLVLFIAVLVSLSTYKIKELATDTKTVLQDNYQSLEYVYEMLHCLDKLPQNKESLADFTVYLQLQQKNITEVGEGEATKQLTTAFNTLQQVPTDTVALGQARKSLYEIMQVNMKAIQRKNNTVEDSASKTTNWLLMFGTCTFLVAFMLLVNLPQNIANPLQELLQSIQEIAAQNYSKRVHFENHNEYGNLALAFNKMAEKLEEYNNSTLAKAIFEKKRMDTLLNSLKNPIIVLDEKEKILLLNEQAATILGSKAEKLVGKNVQDLYANNDLLRTLTRDLSPENPVPNEVLRIYADNKESYFEKEVLPIIVTPTGESTQKLLGYVIILQNITPFKELDLAKTNFIMMLSHEITTPIDIIKRSIEVLKTQKEQQELIEIQQPFFTAISENIIKLNTITKKLLNMTQVETGSILLNLSAVEVAVMLAKVVQTQQTYMLQHDIQVLVNCPENLPKVEIDEEQTIWVLNNLLRNALQYSYDHATVFIEVISKKNTLHILVKDTGQGIEQQYLEKLFQPYFRVPNSRREGNGLGLYISKKLIEAQKGQLLVHSELGAGSTFTVVFNTVRQTT